MKKICLRSSLFSPYLWALAGTPAPPLNICYVLIYWLGARLRRSPALPEAIRCLNVQITFTLIFVIPLVAAFCISAFDHPGEEVSLSVVERLTAGFPLGMISLAGILLLAFFNVRSFAYKALSIPGKRVPRVKFLKEAE